MGASEPTIYSVVAGRIKVPMRQHHISVFRQHIKFRTSFTDRYPVIRDGAHAVFFFSQESSSACMLVTDRVIPREPVIRYLSSNNKKDRRLSLWREPVCDMLRGVFHDSLLPYDRVTCKRPSLRLSAELVSELPVGWLFHLQPTRDLYDMQQRSLYEGR